MKTWQKFGVILIAILIVVFGFLSWYRYTYSMDYVETYAVNSEDLSTKVLIATQGSIFKEEVVKKLIAAHASDEVFFKVIDVSHLSEITVDDWNAIVIIHTWENWHPPLNVETFINHNYNADKIVVLTTSGDGGYKMEGVDAITGESNLIEVDEQVWHIKKRLDVMLGGL